ncbi:helix-turn-helix domain-containing protein [Adhaeribacter sp. BT258]|uniref:Helix-turn-helix domain-containing protein n=1 Tax=Adhaeribacter terrigena TaxID=2793070 RepID=A0ABS1C127_9BACT|nr:helix-turn-helix transcriptional regulator [Adhaeribacter terrigena]MBK0403105.1 helix-turn-helix domain-containing protein [Adhaeribacter terrigena]
MTDRLRKIATFFNLSPADFADLVGVSRPVISHIFSERNKPSLEVVQKIGAAFPDLNLEWLLFGNGEMLKSIAAKQPENVLAAEVKSQAQDEELVVAEAPITRNTSNNVQPEPLALPQLTNSQKVIRIVFFYADNTFSEFCPSEKG